MDNIFKKPPTTHEQQIDLLQRRGMLIGDIPHAILFLSYCSYYRFCGYALCFEKFVNGERQHIYRPETTFEKVEAVYHFDATLRRILFHYSSIIEIQFRSAFAYESANYYHDPHWFLNSESFVKSEQHDTFLELCRQETEKSQAKFIKAYKEKYSFPDLPPIWMLTEIMSFGCLSNAYKNLKDNRLKDLIATRMGIPSPYLASWLHTLTILRNTCAHHARLWNHSFSVPPRLTSEGKKKIIPGEFHRLGAILVIVYEMLLHLNCADDFKREFLELCENTPQIQPQSMGINQASDIFKLN